MKPFYARHYRLILLLVVFLLPLVSRGTRLAIEGNNNDIKDWLPPNYPESADVKWFQQHFPGEQFALVSWEGCTLGDTRKLDLLARKLVARDTGASQTERSRFFSHVVTGPGMLEEMTGPPLSLDYGEVLARLEGSLIGPAPEGEGDDGRATCLMVTLSDEGKRTNRNKRRALKEIERAAAECAIPTATLHMGGPPVDNVAIDVEGERTLYRLAVLAGVVGLGLSYWCFRSIRLTAIVFAVGVLSAGISLALVYYFGLAECFIQGIATARFGTIDAILMSMPAVVYVLGLSGAIHIVNYYRDACREKGLQGAAELAVRHGWVPCTLAALTTALGLASLYTSDITPIRKFGIFSAVGVLGTLSLLFTLLPACLYRFASGEKETGVKTGVAGGGRDSQEMSPFGRWIAQRIIRHNGWVCAVWAVVMIVFGLGLARIDTSVQLLNLFAADADIIADYSWLERHLGNLVPMELVLTVEPSVCRTGKEDAEANGRQYRMNLLERMELVERVQARVESLEDVGRALSVATFAPSARRSGTHLVKLGTRFAVNSGLEEHYHEGLLSTDFLAEERVTQAGHDGANAAGPSRQFWRVSARVAALSDVDYGEFVAQIRHVVEPVLATYRQRDQVLQALRTAKTHLRHSKICLVTTDPVEAGTAGRRESADLLRQLLREAGAHVRSLPLARLLRDPQGRPIVPEALTVWLNKRDAVVVTGGSPDGEALDLATLGVADPTVVDLRGQDAAEDSTNAAVSTTYTGIVPLVYKTQRQLLISLRESIGWAFALIAVVMICVLRSPTAGLLSMIPNVFPIVLVFGAMGWLGIKVDIGIMMTASVALGVAVDDTVHFLFWFRRGIRGGRDRREATMLAYERCSRAMSQTTLVGGLGLAVFAFSTFTPTQQFGVLMLTLLVAALVGDLLLLPAILAGPVGKLFCGRLRPEGTEQPPPPAEEHFGRPHGWSAQQRQDTPHRSVRA